MTVFADYEAAYLASLLRMDARKLTRKRASLQRKFQDEADLSHVDRKIALNRKLLDSLTSKESQQT